MQEMKRTGRPFQERVCEAVLQGNNVVLQAPTGAGKTRAALEPFALNLKEGESANNRLPLTCRYAVPMRALANQFYAEYKELAARIDRAGFSELERSYKKQGLQFVAEQTGEVPEDRRLEAGLTFCTIDQLLAAFLALPYGVGRRQTNLKVAGVLGSYLVLDEWHLYPLRALARQQANSIHGARTTTLAMLELLSQQKLARFVLMTATFSTTLLQEIADILGADLENLRQGVRGGESAEDAFRREYKEIAGDRSRTFCRQGRPLEECVETILSEHQGSTLVICNTVERAQRLYLQLRDSCARMGTTKPELLLLHSRFSADDRRDQARKVEDALGDRAWEARRKGEREAPNLIVVATQVVEVGLNISAVTMHTEIAPANSLVQRAGRCARFAGQHGAVYVYPLADGSRSGAHRPYQDPLCHATLAALEDEPEQFDFEREQVLINAVHTDEDRNFIIRYKQERKGIQKQIFEGWQTQPGADAAADLIRDIRQVPVLIHDDPRVMVTEEPWRWQTFGLHPDSLAGRWDKRLQELASERECDWSAYEMVITGERGDAEADSRAPLRCDWKQVVNREQIRLALMIALPTKLAQYDQELGFVLLDPERLPGVVLPVPGEVAWQSKKMAPKLHSAYISTRSGVQSYLEHISGLIHAYQRGLRSEMAWAATQLERELELPEGSIDASVRVALACHDIGKLTRGWQRWAHTWQQAVAAQDSGSRNPQQGELLAKTDFDGSRASGHRDLQKTLKVKRPPHAVEGVALGEALLTAAIKDIASSGEQNRLLQALLTAIARHHTTHAQSNQEATLAPGAPAVIREALRLSTAGQPWADRIPMLVQGAAIEENVLGDGEFIEMRQGGNDQAGVWLYFLIVRALRLADQRADTARA